MSVANRAILSIHRGMSFVGERNLIILGEVGPDPDQFLQLDPLVMRDRGVGFCLPIEFSAQAFFMTDLAGSLGVPVQMASEALTMVYAFESWLADVFMDDVLRMTGFAGMRGELRGFGIMVAGFAVGSHSRHV